MIGKRLKSFRQQRGFRTARDFAVKLAPVLERITGSEVNVDNLQGRISRYESGARGKYNIHRAMEVAFCEVLQCKAEELRYAPENHLLTSPLIAKEEADREKERLLNHIKQLEKTLGYYLDLQRKN